MSSNINSADREMFGLGEILNLSLKNIMEVNNVETATCVLDEVAKSAPRLADKGNRKYPLLPEPMVYVYEGGIRLLEVYMENHQQDQK